MRLMNSTKKCNVAMNSSKNRLNSNKNKLNNKKNCIFQSIPSAIFVFLNVGIFEFMTYSYPSIQPTTFSKKKKKRKKKEKKKKEERER